jgi:hypothetical protein
VISTVRLDGRRGKRCCPHLSCGFFFSFSGALGHALVTPELLQRLALRDLLGLAIALPELPLDRRHLLAKDCLACLSSNVALV